MKAARGLRIAIVGGGVSGALTAAHIARLWPDGPTVTLFERGGRDARGLAYDTFEPGHLLNVRASNMSAFTDSPKHFERWLIAQSHMDDQVHHTPAGSFASRALYGRYLESVLRAVSIECRDRPVRIVHGDIVALKRLGGIDGFELRLGDGRTHAFDAVVLAMGNVTEREAAPNGAIANPWSPGATLNLDCDKPVLIQGTGLTMVDTVIALRRQGFHGRIFAMSRRGLLPQVHAETSAWPTRRIEDIYAPRLSDLMRKARGDIEYAADNGACWRAALDALRGVTQEIWLQLPLTEKARFLRHLRPYWDSHRHRIAPPIARMLAHEQAAGGLKVFAGRIQLTAPIGGGGLRVTYRPRGGAEPATLDIQRLIMATGIPDLATAHDPFIDSLVVDGIARFDPLGIGLDVDRTLQVLDGEGEPVSGLWALGPLVRGVFWECIAVPDIRRQAAHVAHALTGQLRKSDVEKPGMLRANTAADRLDLPGRVER